MNRRELLIVGNRGGSNVGESFERAARHLDMGCFYVNAQGAMVGNRLLQQFSWHFLGRRPLSLRSFSQHLLDTAIDLRPGILLTTGIAPVDAGSLEAMATLGIIRCNFLTDDPWSASHRNSWFLPALKHYDFVFTPRRTIRADLQLQTHAQIIDLPFGLDPELFHPVHLTTEETTKYKCDVMFAGGADRDRIPYLAGLQSAGLRVGLYGSYWERFAETRNITRGQISIGELPKAIAAAELALCLVRRANRDQHCMRTFEVPAVGSCMLTEDTDDHRELFGPEGEAVLYFRGVPDMVDKARWLIGNGAERNRMARAGRRLITSGGNTYTDRLSTILRFAFGGARVS